MNSYSIAPSSWSLFRESDRDVGQRRPRGTRYRGATAQREGVNADTVLIESIGGVAADLILAHAKQWQPDLIVMGTHGRRGLARLALGSDAEQVVRAAMVPVMLVRGVVQQGKVTPEVTLVEASAA